MKLSDLETPGTSEDLYLARGAEVADLAYRPIFTGDVFQMADGSRVAVIQHPCAFRNGATLSSHILVADVAESGQSPTDWSKGHYKFMYLPEASGTSRGTWRVSFLELRIVTPQSLQGADRVAILSSFGVNLLLQRWLHHNSRVVVPTGRLQESTSGPFDEADLIGESVFDLLERGMSRVDADQWIDSWFGDEHAGSGISRRDALNSRQSVASVRSSLRKAILSQ